MSLHDQHNRLIDQNQNPTSEYTLRKMQEYYQGPIYKMFSRLPSYKRQLSPTQIKRFKTIMDSMTDNELDGPKPEQMGVARMQEIARGSRQDVKQVRKMLKEYKRLEKVWRDLERYMMSDTKLIYMSALFWNEIATPFHVEMVPEPEYITIRFPHPKFELMALVKWAPILGFLYLVFGRH